ncbi:MAG: RNA polymerase subunit sigma-24, partial [Thermoanaerobaculia bacterium]
RVALARGDRATSQHELLLAGRTPGSPQLNSFGPNMALANDLLRAGERETVFEYFDECERFWESGGKPIHRWKTLARFHLPPDFGANLLF